MTIPQGMRPTRHRDLRLAARHIDDGDIVAEPVRDIERLLVGRQGHAPGRGGRPGYSPRSCGSARRLWRTMRGMAERDIGGLAVPGHWRGRPALTSLLRIAGRQEVELAGDRILGAVDDIDLARHLGRDPQLPCRRAWRREAARPGGRRRYSSITAPSSGSMTWTRSPTSEVT